MDVVAAAYILRAFHRPLIQKRFWSRGWVEQLPYSGLIHRKVREMASSGTGYVHINGQILGIGNISLAFMNNVEIDSPVGPGVTVNVPTNTGNALILGDPLEISMWCPWPKAHHSGLTRRNVPPPNRLRRTRRSGR